MSALAFKNELRGTLTKNAPLGAQSWFRCGGTADLLFEPADLDDLQGFLSQYCHPERSEGSEVTSDPLSQAPQDDIVVLGGLANTIIRDGGVRGCVIRLGKAFAGVEVLDECRIKAGAGALNGTVAAAAAKAGIGGLEFLSGIPGTVGGALAMNAGAYGTEVKDVLIGVTGIDRAGEIHHLGVEDLNMSYRHTDIPEGMIFAGATFKGTPEDKTSVKARLKEIKQKRQDTQPIADKTGGSTFANPSAEELQTAGLPAGMRAWEIVEKVGGRGFSIGGAQMSEKHCNFMINTGDATAADLESLGEEMRKRAHEEFGLTLHWEIKRIGNFLSS